MPKTKVTSAPCLKYYVQAVSDFPSLRKAIRSLGLEPLHVEVVRGHYGFSERTIIVKIELSLEHLPVFYRCLAKENENLCNKVEGVCRTRISYTPKKHLIFPITCPDTMPSSMTALHLDLETCQWSVGPGRIPEISSTI